MFKKVFIPTAGIGSRLYPLTKYINKSLVPVALKPAITRIIEMFPANFNIVIALGYKSDIVKQYLRLVHPKSKITFVNIENFFGKGSGLSHTLSLSKRKLQEPFIFCSCDTIVEQNLNFKVKKNIIFFKNKKSNKYRTLIVRDKKLKYISSKNNKDSKKYIGLAYIFDYKNFWNFSMHKNNENGEVDGINYLIKNNKNVIINEVDKWLDVGEKNYVNYEKEFFNLDKKKLPNILPKEDEFIYFHKNKVIKFSNNLSFIRDRVKRNFILEGYVPKIKKFSKNFYFYHKIDGEVLSKKININLFKNLLQHCKKFWAKKIKYPKSEKKNFINTCNIFYKNKTNQRLKILFKQNNKLKKINKLNKKKIYNIYKIINKIDWRYLSEGIPVNFHGDLHFENILLKNKKFYFLDYRQNFNKNYYLGDIYYDLAKIMHGIYVNHNDVIDKKYHAELKNSNIDFKINKNTKYQKLLIYFEKWIIKNKYDLKKVRLITGLIFLNIAPLHQGEYKIFLYAIGLNIINEHIDE